MQRTYYDQQHDTPPIYPNGVNGIEARVKAIEVHLWHERQRSRETENSADAAHGRISALERSITTVVHKVGMWVIGALATATISLALITLKYMFPGHFN
jgi:hypothetical protein